MMKGMRRWCCNHNWWWLALVALSKKPKCVNLSNEVGHTSPSTKPKPNHQYPYHNECIENIHCCPAWHEERRFFSSILQNNNSNTKLDSLKSDKRR
ncbi:auxin transporter protein [Trifolium repens]|nr:auxin transporter protein [Trifolium repens]